MFWLLVFIRAGGSYGRRPVGYVVLCLALALLVLGGMVIVGHQQPTCGGDVMVAGQLCRRDAVDRTYEQVRHEQRLQHDVVGPILVGSGALLLALGLFWTLRGEPEPTAEPPVLPSAPMWTPYAAQVAATARAAQARRSAPPPPAVHHDP